MVTACDDEQRAAINLDTNPEAYKYLSGGLLLSPGIDDAQSFAEVGGGSPHETTVFPSCHPATNTSLHHPLLALRLSRR